MLHLKASKLNNHWLHLSGEISATIFLILRLDSVKIQSDFIFSFVKLISSHTILHIRLRADTERLFSSFGLRQK